MKKKILLTFLLLLMLMIPTVSTSAASVTASGSCGTNLTWTLTDDGTLTISGSGDMDHYVYQANSYAPWSSYTSSIKKIVLPDGLTIIGYGAFAWCNSLTDINIPDSVTAIYDYAFENCSALTGITIPDNVTYIGDDTFYGCTALEEINIPEGVTIIKGHIFYNCTSLKKISIPNSVTRINDHAFGYCESLTDVYYDGSATDWNAISIGEDNNSLTNATIHYAVSNPSGTDSTSITWKLDLETGTLTFTGTGKLTGGPTAVWYTDYAEDIKTIVIGDGITELGYNAFSHDGGSNGYYDNLKTVVMADSVTTIGDDVFEDCPALENITFSKNLTWIGAHAFENATALKSITFPETETALTLGSGVFSGCDALESVTLGKNVSVGYSDFSDCTALKDVYFRGTKAEWENMSIDATGNEPLKNATVHFLNDTQYLVGGVCGDGLTWALDEPSDGEYRLIFSGSGYMYDFTAETQPWRDYADQIKTVLTTVVGTNIYSIGDYAFYNCSNLTDFTMPTYMYDIGDYAFYNCGNLPDIAVSDYIRTVGHSAFRTTGTDSITITHLSKNLGSADHYAFFKCKFTEDTLDLSNLKTMGKYSFASCEMGTILIGNQLGTIESNAFNCSVFAKAVIGSSVAQINSGAFTFCNVSDGIYFCGNVPNYPEASNTFIAANNSELRIYVAEDHLESHSGQYYDVEVWKNEDHATVKGKTTAATCTEAAYTTYSCEVCGFNHNVSSGEPAGHTEQIVPGTPATSTETGLTDGIICSVCGKVLKEQEIIELNNPSGTAGDNITWELDLETGTLTISGTGDMYDFENGSPWLKVSYTETITSVVIEDGVTSVGDFAFLGCSVMTEITLPESITSIGTSAFQNCYSLSEITIPQSVTSIEKYAFMECPLSKIVIPEGVTTIKEGTFAGCTELSEVSIPKSVTSIDYYAFYYCSALSDVYYGGTKAEWDTISIGTDNEDLLDATLHCVTPTSGKCGENLTWEFNEATGTLTISGTGPMYTYDDDDNYEDYSPWLGHKDNITSVIFSEGITEIGYCAFYNHDGITSITIPNSVTSIKDSAFGSCSNLETVDLGDGCSLREEAFYLTPVKNLNLGSSSYFGPRAFSSGSLTSITIAANNPSFADGAFWSCENLKEVYFKGSAPSSVTDKDIMTSTTLSSFRDDVVWYYDCGQSGWLTSSRYNATSKTWAGYTLVSENHAHKEIITAPTCTEQGYTSYECPCGDSYIDINTYVPEKGHTEVTDAGYDATCTETGLTEGSHCSVCGEVSAAQEIIPVKGHTEVIDNAKEPTCTETGLTEGKHCDVCDKVLTAQEIIPAKDHDYAGEITTEATCAAEGVMTYTCQNDTSHTYTEAIPKKAHTEVTIEGEEATCTETGTTDGKYCSACRTMLTRPEVIPAKGHTEVTDAAVEPTCTETGLTEGSHCDVCGKVSVAQEVVPVKDHTEVVDNAKEPTCTETGLTEGSHCDVCGKVLTPQTTVPEIGHDYAGNVTTEATCEAEGVMTYTCQNDSSHTYTEAIPKKDHTEVTIKGKEANCTETGKTDMKYCSVCSTVTAVQEIIPAKGHTEVTDAGKESTCAETGLTEGKHCDVCGEVTVPQTEIPPKDHTEVIDAGKEATCTETGLTEGKHCSVCGEITVPQTEIPVTGHTFTETFQWADDLTSATAVLACDCGHSEEQPCKLTWDNSQSSRLTVTATLKLNEQTFSESKEISAVKEGDSITLTFDAVYSDLKISAAAYNNNGQMTAYKAPETIGKTVTLAISGDQIHIFFMTEKCCPISPFLQV